METTSITTAKFSSRGLGQNKMEKIEHFSWLERKGKSLLLDDIHIHLKNPHNLRKRVEQVCQASERVFWS